jgi:hypothetical protein
MVKNIGILFQIGMRSSSKNKTQQLQYDVGSYLPPPPIPVTSDGSAAYEVR